MVSEDWNEDSSLLATVKKEHDTATIVGETAIPSIHDLKEKFIALAGKSTRDCYKTFG